MNKFHHRLIYNKSRGCMMAVAETATSSSKSPSSTSKTRRKSSKCSKTSKNGQFYLSKVPPAQWIQAQAAINSVVFANYRTTLQNHFSAVTARGNIPLNNVTLDQNSWANGNNGQSVMPYSQGIDYRGAYVYRTYRGEIWTIGWGPTAMTISPLGGYESSFSAGGTIGGVGNTLLNGAGLNANTQLGSQSTTAPSAPGAATGRSATTSVGVPTNLSLPTGGLFKITASPTARYLIETNPAFTSQTQWLSSDFYFTQLGYNPTAVQKRLGDGYYEQRLVQEQIMALTGRAILPDPNAPDAQSQYQALMLAGAQYAKALQLAPGIGLSQAQVAELASDVVILQEVQVAGQTVLTPVVYLSPNKQSRLLTSGLLGPVITANDIDLTASLGISNNGLINANRSLTLASNTSINNRGGQLQSGGQMSLSSLGNIDLTSAQLKAGSLSLSAGQRLILNTDSAQVSSQVEGGQRTSTLLGKRASIDVAGNASITTGTDFEQNAGTLTVGGNLSAQIGGSWNLGAVEDKDTINAQTRGGFSNTAGFVRDVPKP